MASLTRAQLMTQAGLASGNDQTTAFVRTWLDAWLRRTAKSWAWPVLKVRIADIPIASGALSVGFGLGLLTTYDIHRIFAPIFYRNSSYSLRGRMTIRELLDGDPETDESVTLAANRLGVPETCKIRRTASDAVTPAALGGQTIIYPNPVPNQALYLSFDAHYIPTNIGSTTAADSTIPWYPADRTLLQACKVAFLEYDDGGEGGKALTEEGMKLAQMVVDDRDFDGEGPGDNVQMSLDKSVFL